MGSQKMWERLRPTTSVVERSWYTRNIPVCHLGAEIGHSTSNGIGVRTGSS